MREGETQRQSKETREVGEDGMVERGEGAYMREGDIKRGWEKIKIYDMLYQIRDRDIFQNGLSKDNKTFIIP